jgi:uncharacterized protein (TIGR02099 family)
MRLRAATKILLYSFAGLVGVLLLLLLGVKLALDRAPRYQAEIKEWVHAQTGYHIAFEHVSPAFRWYGPELYFDRLELRSKDDQRVLARAAGGRIAADVWQLLRSGRLLAGHIELDAPSIAIERLGADRFAIASEFVIGGDTRDAAPVRIEDIPLGTLAIRHAAVTLQNWNKSLPQLTVQNVSIDFKHDAHALTLLLAARLPAALGGDLNLRAKAEGPGDFAALPWSLVARGRGISFSGWQRLLPEYLASLDAGVGAFDATASGRGAELARAELDFAASGVVTRLGQGPVANFDQMSGVLTLVHAGDDWNLSGRRVHASRRDPESAFDVVWRRNEQGLKSLNVRASYLRAETLLPLTVFLPQQEVRNKLREIAPSGEWMDTSLNLARDAGNEPWHLNVQARFRNAGFAPVGRAPGLRGLTGSLAGTEGGGHLFIDSDHAVFDWPLQFPQPIDLSILRTRMYWQRSDAELLLASPEFTAKTPDAELRGKFSFLKPADDSSPVLTLVSTVQNGNVAAAKNYLPRALLGPGALNWLNRAFLAGHLSRADASFQGPLRSFPFRDGGGEFLVRAYIEGLKLDYSEGWPLAEDLTGQAEFHNEGLTVKAASGRLGDIPIGNAEARFADFKTGELKIKAAGHGDAAVALAYLRDSPLDAMAEHLFSQAEAHGALDANVELFLPFKDFVHRRVQVHGQLHDASANKVGSDVVASGVDGDFDIDGAQVAHADLHGELLGGVFQMQARSPRNRPVTRTQLDFRGTATADALRTTLSLPPALPFSGTADWRAVLKLAPEPNRERSLRISSTLAGLELRLPAPLEKSSGAPLPSWLDIQWLPNGPQGRLAIGSLVSGSYALKPDEDGYRLVHASLTFGTDELAGGDAQILNVGGSVERVDLAGWLALNKPDKNGKPLAYYLRNATLNVAELDYWGLAFHDVSIDLNVIDSGLHIKVGGPNVVGSIDVPNAAQEPWSLEFEKLRFEVAGPDDLDLSDPAGAAAANDPAGLIGPRAVPPLDFHAAQLIWSERRFGDVRATLRKLDDGIQLRDLTVTGPTFNVKADGEWRGSGSGDARIVGAFTSTDVASTLKDLGYADAMQARSGKMDFDLHWTGPPTSAALANVGGKVQLAFDKGQVTGIKPGAGRVLALTSIVNLPRRLLLDFSDLTDKGLAFDSIRGDFELRDGSAYTDNVLLKGPAAEIGLIGRVGLKNRDYDQTAVVTGSIGNSLPLAALVGGPVVAGAVLVFTQVFKQPLKGLARGYYRITGGWDNPTVERIKGAEAAAATAEAPK